MLILNNRIFELQQSLVKEIDEQNHITAGADDDQFNPEAQNLLNIHSEMQDQEDNLVRARRIGHDNLKVGEELK